MNKKAAMSLIKNKGQELIEKRREDINSALNSSIRPQGKWHGLDVFSWHNPLNFELESTICAFPFPVILVCYDYNDIKRTMQTISFQEWVCSCILIDSQIINGDDLDGVVVVPDLNVLSDKLLGFKAKGILLFLYYDQLGMDKFEGFVNYQKRHIVK